MLFLFPVVLSFLRIALYLLCDFVPRWSQLLAFLLVWFVPRDSPSLHLDSVARSHLMFAIFLDEFDCDPIVVAVVPPLASAPAPPPPSPSEQLPHPCCGACIFSCLSLSLCAWLPCRLPLRALSLSARARVSFPSCHRLSLLLSVIAQTSGGLDFKKKLLAG